MMLLPPLCSARGQEQNKPQPFHARKTGTMISRGEDLSIPFSLAVIMCHLQSALTQCSMLAVRVDLSGLALIHQTDPMDSDSWGARQSRGNSSCSPRTRDPSPPATLCPLPKRNWVRKPNERHSVLFARRFHSNDAFYPCLPLS